MMSGAPSFRRSRPIDLDPGAAGNWLVISIPISQVMLCGDNALPLPVELDPYAQVGVEVFLAAYGSP
jgi:TetR/AcrR family transcriptional repressor of mexJK operon